MMNNFKDVKKIKKSLFIKIVSMVLLSMIIVNLFGCESKEYIEKSKMALGTVITVKVSGNNAGKAIDKAFLRVDEIEKEMSVKIKDSKLSDVNNNAYNNEVEVSDDLFFVLDKALYYANLSDGAFDPSIGKIIDAWGIGTENEHVLSEEQKKQFIKSCSYKNIILNKEKKTVKFDNKNVKIDLGAIVKGYVADEMKKIMVDEEGIKSAMLNLGGNVVTIGDKNDGKKWTVGIVHPKDKDNLFVSLNVSDKMIVTSGNYERYFEKDGVRYHHIINPFTAMPADEGIISSSIVCDKSIDADALSTLTYVCGTKKALDIINNIKDTEAMFISDDLQVTKTQGFDDLVNQFY